MRCQPTPPNAAPFGPANRPMAGRQGRSVDIEDSWRGEGVRALRFCVLRITGGSGADFLGEL